MWRKAFHVRRAALADADVEAVFDAIDTNASGEVTYGEWQRFADAVASATGLRDAARGGARRRHRRRRRELFVRRRSSAAGRDGAAADGTLAGDDGDDGGGGDDGGNGGGDGGDGGDDGGSNARGGGHRRARGRRGAARGRAARRRGRVGAREYRARGCAAERAPRRARERRARGGRALAARAAGRRASAAAARPGGAAAPTRGCDRSRARSRRTSRRTTRTALHLHASARAIARENARLARELGQIDAHACKGAGFSVHGEDYVTSPARTSARPRRAATSSRARWTSRTGAWCAGSCRALEPARAPLSHSEEVRPRRRRRRRRRRGLDLGRHRAQHGRRLAPQRALARVAALLQRCALLHARFVRVAASAGTPGRRRARHRKRAPLIHSPRERHWTMNQQGVAL